MIYKERGRDVERVGERKRDREREMEREGEKSSDRYIKRERKRDVRIERGRGWRERERGARER